MRTQKYDICRNFGSLLVGGIIKHLKQWIFGGCIGTGREAARGPFKVTVLVIRGSTLRTGLQRASLMSEQTKTPYQLLDRPRNTALVEEFIGKPINTLRTPAMIIDRKLFAENCARMHQRSKSWGAGFRAHLKTHKVMRITSPKHVNLFVQTTEGTKLQLISAVDKTQAVVVSTLMEAWEVVQAGLVADSTVKDVNLESPGAKKL